ncbi:IS66 family transposase, partial [Klebsiella oxytoca]
PKVSKPAEAVLRLNKLFEIEKELESLPPEQKKKERINREKPLLEAFWSWAEINSAGELPKSKLHTAFHYALNNRQEFFNYLEDGNCSISNSLAENCIR